jgi:hypothetical protein
VAACLPASPSRLLPAAAFSSAQTAFSTVAVTARTRSIVAFYGLLHRSGELCATDELYIGKLYTPMSLHFAKQQGEVTLKAHVAKVCFKCFRCFKGMLQVFHIWML